MKVALAFSTKDRVELTEQTKSALYDIPAHVFWNDGSATDAGKCFPISRAMNMRPVPVLTRVTGGADAAIVFALTQMLSNENYTHVGLLENDVLLSSDWFAQTVGLFDRGMSEGLEVGAVTARTYEDRILIQRDGYAVLHNAGAGHVIFTRKAAELILEFYRTGWWPQNRNIFSQLSGLDVGDWGAFRTHDSALTADWHFDTILAAHGLATLGLTPSPVEMIGQNPPLEDQGLVLARGPVKPLINESAFRTFAHHTRCVRDGHMKLHFDPWLTQRAPSGATYHTYFAHQLPRIGASFGTGFKLKWSQGFGPFSYVADERALLTLPVFGPCVFIVSGGPQGATIKVSDMKSGYEVEPHLEPEGEHMRVLSLQMPGGLAYRDLVVRMDAGARLFAVQTNEQQPWFPNIRFDYKALPPVKD